MTYAPFAISGFLATLLLSGCTRRPGLSTKTIDTASYALDGGKVKAQAHLAISSQNAQGRLLLSVTLLPELAPGVGGEVKATYETSVATPKGPFTLRDLSYSNYLVTNDTTHYLLHFTRSSDGTLTRTRTGGYSGTFGGSYDGKAPFLAEVFVLEGYFKDVHLVPNRQE